jgi:predicted exporter
MVVRMAAGGAQTDAQEDALRATRALFAAAQPGAATLTVSGPAVFAVEARAAIVTAAVRLSLLGGALTLGLLSYVYRSLSAVLLGLAPIASGALVGVAAVALGFSTVHGLTLGFGITLIGEAVDYAIYLFVQLGDGNSAAQRATWLRQFWPTIRLGMLTSLCGFAALLFSGFPGLAQLGLYSLTGLLTAALVTRHVLPRLLPPSYRMRDLGAWGSRLRDIARSAHSWRGRVPAAIALAVAALLVLVVNGDHLWQQELASLSPVPAESQQRDAALRAELGTSEVAQAVIVSARDRESALQEAERAAAALGPLVEAGAIGGFESPARFLPSAASQARRRDALPDATTLRKRLGAALEGLPLQASRLAPFVADVEAAKNAPPLTVASLQGTSFAPLVESLLLESDGGWHALLPLRATEEGRVDLPAVRDALARANVDSARVLDLKSESDALYRAYLRETVRLALFGLVAMVALLCFALRSPGRLVSVMAPLLLAVACTMALLCATGRQLSLLHVVGLLLLIAVGSNYALFFDGARRGTSVLDTPSTYASIALACLATVVGFGVLAFAGVPVLVALGETVAIGGVLALGFSALLSGPAARA